MNFFNVRYFFNAR